MSVTIQSHYRSTLQLGFPIIIGQLGIILLSFVDNIMIGRHSLPELSAASFVNNFLSLPLIFGMGFSYGLTPLISQCLDKDKVKLRVSWFLNGFVLNGCIALLIGAGILFWAPYLTFFNVDEELLPFLLPYYRLQAYGFMASMFFYTFKQYFEGNGDTSGPMYITLFGNIINIFLNWLLIYGHWTMPEWGLYGAGIATLSSRLAMILLSIAYLLFRSKYRLDQQAIRWNFFSFSRCRSLIRIGGPVATQMGLESASFSIAVIFVAKLGNASLAAHQIVAVITTLGYLIYYGLGAATAIRISIFRSRKNYVEALQAAKASYHLCLFAGGAMVVGILLTQEYICQLFHADLLTSRIVFYALIPVYLYQVGDALQVIYANALRGMAQVHSLTPLAALCHVIIAPALSYLFAFVLWDNAPEVFRLSTIWFSFPISLTLLGLLLFRQFRRITYSAMKVAPLKS